MSFLHYVSFLVFYNMSLYNLVSYKKYYQFFQFAKNQEKNYINIYFFNQTDLGAKI
jgi:hypothetical protein